MTRSAEISEKLKRVSGLMEAEGLDGLLLWKRPNFAWLTAGGDNHVGSATDQGAASLLITKDARFLLADNIEGPRIEAEEIEGLGFAPFLVPWHEGGHDAALKKKTAGLKLGSDTPLDGARFLGGRIAELRWSLLTPEVERYRKLGSDCAKAITETCKKVKPGLTEFQVAGGISDRLQALGIAPGVILIAADERIRFFRHPIPTSKKVEKCCMVVIGGQRHGLAISMTRLVHFGPLSDDLKRRHQAVVEVDATVIAATKLGATAGQLFATIKQAYATAGFPEEWQFHHQGGATGYAPRDWKAMPDDNAKTVLENQGFAWNPSIAGTKSEDTIIATSKGPENICDTPELPAITVNTEVGPMRRADILVV